MLDPLIIICALICGIAARAVGLPALIGYLAAGFVLHELGVTEGALLSQLAEVGVTLLLFSIGLKLKPADLLESKVWGTALVHMTVTILALAPLLFLLMASMVETDGFGWPQAVLLAFALSFSSTVFAIQVLQERGEMASQHANLGIGVLLMQDIAAVLYIGASTGKVPHWMALGLVLLVPARRLILKLLSMCGHGELFTLFGLALAILGAQLFEAVGVKGDLGALILGVLLAGDKQAKELARSLLQFKDLFLVGFFVTIGLIGWPSAELMIIAFILGILSPLKAPLYFWLMTRFHAPPRVAFLSSASLSNYSEFGLIVIAIAASTGVVDNQWSATLALAIAISFVLSSAANIKPHDYYARWRYKLRHFRSPVLERKRPDVDGIRAIVLGMGNIGTGTYDVLRERYGDSVVGVDENKAKLAAHIEKGRRVIDADASDPDFWSIVRLHDVDHVMLALTNHSENMLVGKMLRRRHYKGRITAIIRFEDEGEELRRYNIESVNLFREAGRGFAEHLESTSADGTEKAASAT
ncbi:MAG: cation:proton antiporter [Woeseiaceae bacterium]|nr:cation:proton antiporter [Woeseiaceae bacterium]